MINHNKTDLVKCAYIVDKVRLMQMSMELHGVGILMLESLV